MTLKQAKYYQRNCNMDRLKLSDVMKDPVFNYQWETMEQCNILSRLTLKEVCASYYLHALLDVLDGKQLIEESLK